MTADTLTKGAAQAAPAPVSATGRAAQAQPVAGDAFIAALGAALAQEQPALAASIEAHLTEALSQARLQRNHAEASAISATVEWLRDLRGAAQLLEGRESAAACSDPDLPPPSAALHLWRLQAEVLVGMFGHDAGMEFLHRMAEAIVNEENLSNVVSIRRVREWRDVSRSRRQAAAYFRRTLNVLVARVPHRGAGPVFVKRKKGEA